MGLIRLLVSAPALFVVLVVPLLYSVIAHEVAHGVCALWFGDDTARRAGRLTLNPLRHLDPMGTLMLFLAGFGWARPVPVNYANLRPARLGVFCVALAGCATNILLAAAALAALRRGAVAPDSAAEAVLSVVAHINIALAAFNLIPIPPLDGSRLLLSLLPPVGRRALAALEPYGFQILILLLLSGRLDPVIGFMQQLITRLL